VHALLRHQGIRCSRKRVARLMRAQGLCAARRRQRKPHTTDSHHTFPIAPNLLERDFTATAPNRKWVADITGVETQEGWLYLAGIVDTYSRYAVGYSLDTRRDEALVESALEMALLGRRPQAGLIHHSDRGSQHTSWGYRAMLESYPDCAEYERERGSLRQCADGELFCHAQNRMCGAPRVSDDRTGSSVYL
jgi:putative transposase